MDTDTPTHEKHKAAISLLKQSVHGLEGFLLSKDCIDKQPDGSECEACKRMTTEINAKITQIKESVETLQIDVLTT